MNIGKSARSCFLIVLALVSFPILTRASAPTFTFAGHLGVYAEHMTAAGPFVDLHGNETFSSASIIKLLIAVGAVRKLKQAGKSLDYAVPIDRIDIVGASDTFGNARPGSDASVRSLMIAMITQSDNTAANALLDWVDESSLNTLAIRLGLRKTSFARHFMDFAARAAGHDNLTSPRDMVLLAKGIATGTYVGYGGASSADCRFIYSQMLRQEDRETIPAGITRSAVIANKTGELVGVRHDVAIVDLGKKDAYVVAILTEDWANRAGAIESLREIAAKVDHEAQK